MINGFENQTHDLTPQEHQLVPFFVRELSHHVGKEHAITNEKLAQKIKSVNPMAKGLKGPRVRKIINFMRLTGKIELLCATSNGYYVARSPKELTDYMNGLRDRINSQQAVFNALVDQYNARIEARNAKNS